MASFPTTQGERGGTLRGLGMQCDFGIVPAADLAAIGVKWVRLDPGGSGWGGWTSAQRAAVIANYSQFEIVITLTDSGNEATDLNHWYTTYGIRHFEFRNEYVQGGGDKATYVSDYNTFRALCPADCIVFAGVDEVDLCRQLYDAGLRPDAWMIHTYSCDRAEILGSMNQLSNLTMATVGMSEGNAGGGAGPWPKGAALASAGTGCRAYLTYLIQNFTAIPVCYYRAEGPSYDATTDGRGLFSYTGTNGLSLETWLTRTATYTDVCTDLGITPP